MKPRVKETLSRCRPNDPPQQGGREGPDAVTASVQCPDKPPPPPIPGQPGPALTTAGPSSFTVPYAGGKQTIAGGITAGGDGWTNNGTMTVTPSGVARIG